MKHRRKVCVIGAGPSGLVAIKELLDENHEVKCFEKSARAGGAFVYDEGTNKDKSGGRVYQSTLLTVSNYFMAFSSFPPQDYEERRFWTHQEYMAYLNRFAEHFGLYDYITFNSTITNIERRSDGKWIVDVNIAKQTKREIFDAVAVCTGTHQIPKQPNIPGIDTFKADNILHAASYRDEQPFVDKNVLIIGLGESGADIAHEISRVAKSCMLSLRRPPFVLNRYHPGGQFTTDAKASRLYGQLLPLSFYEKLPARLEKNLASVKDPALQIILGWQSKTRGPQAQFLVKNEIFVHDIVDGKLKVNLSDVKYIENNKIVFMDEEEFEADIIIMSTGYKDVFDFVKGYEIPDVRTLYKHMIHPDIGWSMAFLGFARPSIGGVPAISEMQARYFALLCSGLRSLPSKVELKELTQKENGEEEAQFCDSPHLKTLVNYYVYMDSFAKLIGCIPSSWSLLSDPHLLYKYYFGSQVSNQYRLAGPHADNETAVKVIKKLPVAFTTNEIAYFLGMGLYEHANNYAAPIKNTLSTYVSKLGVFQQAPSADTTVEEEDKQAKLHKKMY